MSKETERNQKVKVLEFKLDLNKSQQQLVDSWLEDLRWVWNEGLALIQELHHFNYYEWLDKKLDKLGIDKGDIRRCYLKFSKSSAFAAVCPIATGKGDDLRPISSILLPEKPRLRGLKYVVISKKNYQLSDAFNRPLFDAINRVPSKYINGVLALLSKAWASYTDKGRTTSHAIKFKSKLRGDSVNTLYSFQPETIAVEDGKIFCPGFRWLGLLSVVNNGLLKRWPADVQPRTLKICRKASGYYLQLGGNIQPVPVKHSVKSCGLDVGLQYIYADDAGHTVAPPKYYRASEKRLKRLQRKLARQKALNPRGSANQEKTKKKISRTHEKTRLQRRSFNHKLSTYLVRTYDAIAAESIKIANLVRRPKPKKREDGQGYERNNAKAKSGLNKSFADAGLGQLLTMIESKAKACGRTFARVAPHYTSQDCPNCGYRQEKALSQRTHLCAKCGYTTQRDVAAAINIKAKAFGGSLHLPLQSSIEATPLVLGEVTPVEAGAKPPMKQEPTQVGHLGDAETTSNCAGEGVPAGNTLPNPSQLPVLLTPDLNCYPTEIRATPEPPIQTDLQTPANCLEVQVKNSKRRKAKQCANSDAGMQIELDLWGTG